MRFEASRDGFWIFFWALWLLVLALLVLPYLLVYVGVPLLSSWLVYRFWLLCCPKDKTTKERDGKRLAWLMPLSFLVFAMGMLILYQETRISMKVPAEFLELKKEELKPLEGLGGAKLIHWELKSEFDVFKRGFWQLKNFYYGVLSKRAWEPPFFSFWHFFWLLGFGVFLGAPFCLWKRLSHDWQRGLQRRERESREKLLSAKKEAKNKARALQREINKLSRKNQDFQFQIQALEAQIKEQKTETPLVELEKPSEPCADFERPPLEETW